MTTYKPRVDVFERDDEYFPLIGKHMHVDEVVFSQESGSCTTLDAAICSIEKDLKETFIPGNDDIVVTGVSYTDLNEGIAAFRAACSLASVPPTYY